MRRRHPDHQPINTCSSERHNILRGTDHVIESDEHTDFKALGTDVFNPLQQRRQVLGASDIYAVGMLDRHRNRRPSRCTNDDARLGRTINDPRETVERRVGVAGMVGVSSPDFAQGRNRVDQGRSSFSRGSELGSNRVMLARESGPGRSAGADAQPHPSARHRLQRVDRCGELCGVPVHHVRHQETDVDPCRHSGDGAKADKRITRPTLANDRAAEMISDPYSRGTTFGSCLRKPNHVRKLCVEWVDRQVELHQARLRSRFGSPVHPYAANVNRIDADAYLQRLGLRRRDIGLELASLSILQHAHLATVPFENLDIVFSGGVGHDQDIAADKLVNQTRGGWCFEVNGAFAILLEHLGFQVKLLGAAVLLDGPSRAIEHLSLEVSAPDLEPYLVDVGFGDSADRPLALNRSGPQNGGSGQFEFYASPEGTTLTQIVDGVPEARFRFKRVAHRFDDFAPVATAMQVNPNSSWSKQPFATRLIDVDGYDRVTLTSDRLALRRSGTRTEQRLERDEWDAALKDWFGMKRPGPWPGE
ncbi:MAG: N-hydroxyarylamine O-acetyltransferase [Candidatus Aldehydirespiratoraceae bacterium]